MAKILIVDDAAFMRKMLSDIFTAQGHEIVGEGESARDAVEKFKALRPDLMTLDVVMPQVGNIDTPEAIRQIMRENSKAKIVMVSSMGQQAIIAEMLQAGASDFITKPFEQSTVIKTINRILKS